MKRVCLSVASSVGAHFSPGSPGLTHRAVLMTCLGMWMPLAALAQGSGNDPYDTRTVPAVPVYESAFSDYQPYQDPEILSWKAANDVVREFGGMAAMKEAGEDGSASHSGHRTGSTDQARPAAPSAPDGGHAGHGAPAAGPSAAPSQDHPTDRKTPPGHDMSKMPQASPASPATPAPKPVAPAAHGNMPGHGGMSH